MLNSIALLALLALLGFVGVLVIGAWLVHLFAGLLAYLALFWLGEAAYRATACLEEEPTDA